MNSSSDMNLLTIEIDDDESRSPENDQYEDDNDNNNRQSGTHLSHSCVTDISTTNIGSKRQKDISPCYVCGAKAHGYNFDQITCESCKAFFRRNALKSMDKFRCRNNNECGITSATRKRCKRCRLTKCFKVGMRKEWILTDEEKRLKKRKIERNRLIKEQAQLALSHQQHQNNSSSSTIECSPSSSSNSQRPISTKSCESRILPLPLLCMPRQPDQQMYERQQYFLQQLSHGYQSICQQYPQPKKFAYRNAFISQTIDMDSKLMLVKDLTRELTQMTTSRLLHYFTLIPEFRLFTELEKKSILIKNMLAVFMFHGALTYNAENDTFVDRTTADQPYDAQYLLLVYGSRVYNDFTALARGLTFVSYQSLGDKESDERAHTLFLLLMVILLFSNGFENCSNGQGQKKSIENESTINRSLSITSDSSSSSLSPSISPFSASKFDEKLYKIQQIYVEMACRYLQDEFGLTIGRRMFQNLLPLLYDLQKLCSTLANVNLCELADDEDRLSSSPTTIQSIGPITSGHQTSQIPSSQFNSTMISGTSHLNELQKENRAPPPPPSNSLSTSRSLLTTNSISSSPFLLNTMPTFENYQI